MEADADAQRTTVHSAVITAFTCFFSPVLLIICFKNNVNFFWATAQSPPKCKSQFYQMVMNGYGCMTVAGMT